MFNFFKKKTKTKNKYIDLEEFAEIRKNKKTIYSDEDIINYCLRLFKEHLIRFEEIDAEHIKNKYSGSSEYYDYQISLEIEDVYKKFVGLTLINLLNIIKNDKNFNNKLENLMKDFIGIDILEELTHKTEFEFENIERIIEYEKNRPLGRGTQRLYAKLYLFFKYD